MMPKSGSCLTKILYYADFISIDVVLTIQCVTPIWRNRQASGELCRRFSECGQYPHLPRCQIDKLQGHRSFERIDEVDPTLPECPEPMAGHRLSFPNQLLLLVSQTAVRESGLQRATPDSGQQHIAVV